VKDSLSDEEKMNGTSMCGVWLLHDLLLDQLSRCLLVVVVREKGRVVQGSVQWGISGCVHSRGSDEWGMVSNGRLVVSRSMGQEWRVVSSVWGVVAVICDQRCWCIDGSVQCWCSHDWCHDAWLVNEGGCRVLWLNSGLICLDVGTESQSVSDVVHDAESSVSISQSVRSNFASVSITSLPSERSTSRVVLIVSKGIVTNVILAPELR